MEIPGIGPERRWRTALRALALPTLASTAALLLAACAAPPNPSDVGYPEIDFRDREPIRIAAGALEIVDLYRPPLAAPHAEHLSPAIPSLVFARWARRRLAPVGGPARVVVTIADARIVETPLVTDDSLQGAVTVEQAARLDGRGAVEVALVDPAGAVLARAHGEATQRLSLPEDASPDDRRQAMYRIVADLSRRLDEVLDREVRRYFAPWLR